jgi:uracil-DNA glycosylase family 4
MLGFFNKEEEVNKKGKKSDTTSMEMARKHSCKVCPLTSVKGIKTRNMQPSGSDNPLIYNLGEAPGAREDEKGKPFIGKAGDLLKKHLSLTFDNKFVRDKMRFNNVLTCRPPDNRTPTDFEIACCKRRLEKDIATTKPLIIAAFGGTALRALLGVDRIFEWRGRVIPIKIRDHVCWLMPQFHPSFILRNSIGDDEDPVERKNRMYLDTFIADMQRMSDVLTSDKKPHVVDPDTYYDDTEYIYGKNIEKDLKRLRKRVSYFKTRDRIFIDIETDGDPNGLRPENEDAVMLSCAISDDEITVAFPVEHPEAWGNRVKIQRMVLEEIRDVVATVREKGAHNSKFECSWISYKCGEACVRKGRWIDTQARGYTLDERAGGKKGEGVGGLGSMTLMWLGFNVKKLSDLDKKHMKNEPLSKILPYNGLDAKYEYMLNDVMEKEFPEELQWVFQHENRLGLTLAMTEHKGVPLDVNMAKRIGRRLDRQRVKIANDIEELEEIKLFKKRFHTEFKVGSNDHIAKILENVLHLAPVKLTKGGKNKPASFSTDKEVMAVYAEQGVDLAQLIVADREAQKLKSTYVDSSIRLVYSNGILRPDFNHLFVSTGRLSASDPNIQNFPNKPDNRFIRAMIRAPEDYWLVTFDYSQIEARMIATIANDEWFIDAIWNNLDIHEYWAKIVGKRLGIDIRDKTELKNFRKIIKNAWVFPLAYGSSQESAENDLGAQSGQLKREYNRFWDELRGVKSWQDALLQFYREHQYVESPLGRRRHGPLSKNEQLNNMIQGVASDVVTDAMNRLSFLAYKLRKPQYRPIWNIHDDLGFLIPDRSLERDIEFIAEQMCKVRWKWIKVPIGVECSVGKRWHNMQEIEKYDSRMWNFTRR